MGLAHCQFINEENQNPMMEMSVAAIVAPHWAVMGDEIGPLEVGKYDDVPLMNMNVRDADVEDLQDFAPEMTYFGEKLVYKAE